MLETICVSLKDTQRIIVQTLKDKGPMSIADLVTAIGYPEKNIKTNIQELLKLQLIVLENNQLYRYSCLEKMKQLEKAPFNNDIGRKVQQTSCTECWKKWISQQTILMNHFGLNPIDPQAQKFLFGAMDSFFFGDGTPPMLVDTSLQGTIEH